MSINLLTGDSTPTISQLSNLGCLNWKPKFWKCLIWNISKTKGIVPPFPPLHAEA